MISAGNFLINETLNNPLSSWLTHKGVMTDKLASITGYVDLHVLRQQKVNCSVWDKMTLGIGEQESIYRDVQIAVGAVTYWFARTIIPLSTFISHIDFFERLQNESLGRIIFDNPAVTRTSLVHYEINSTSHEFNWFTWADKEVTPTLWVRRSNFKVDQADSFFLFEILLPDLMRLSN